MSLDDYLICPHICATVLLITIFFRSSIGLFQNLTHKVGRLVSVGPQYQYFGNKSQQSALSASSKSSTEPLFFILCSCKKSRQRTNHYHHYQQQKNHYLSSCVPCQKARHWSQIRGNTCQSQVVTEQYVSCAYTNM